ncbi:MAG: hypothetical protein EOP46_14380 [Sphingobacteriaceae bacterium]|nr:MAG: hypothetical protein EOP46_14380 [Sphingobacteriaceae bacterium]
MKKIIIIILLMLPVSAICQTKLIWDFKSGTKPVREKTLKASEVVRFEIKNINTFLYKIEVNVEGKSFFQENSAGLLADIITQLRGGDFVGLFKAFAESPAGMSVMEIREAKNKEQIIKTLLINLKENIVNLDSVIARFQNRDKLFCFEGFDDTKLSEYTDDFSLNLKEPTRQQLDKDKTTALKYLSEIDKTIKKLNRYDLSGQTELSETLTEIKGKLTATDYREDIEALYKKQLVLSLDKFKFISDEYELIGDETIAKLYVKPIDKSDEEECKGTKTDSVTVKFPVVKKFRVTFSTGFFISNLTDKRYAFKDVTAENSDLHYDTVTYKRVVDEKNDKVSIGITALTHFTYKLDKFNEIGIHIGAGAPIQENFKINYLAGFTYFFGYKQRIGVNFGVAGGFIDVLSNTVDFNRKYPPGDEVSVTNVKRFVFDRIQCSITFNIGDFFK